MLRLAHRRANIARNEKLGLVPPAVREFRIYRSLKIGQRTNYIVLKRNSTVVVFEKQS